jgi:minor extracellular serine protease Vpr
MTARARRARTAWLALTFALCAAPAAFAAPAQAGPPPAGVRVIVRLAPPPLALVAPGRRRLMGVGSVERLDASSFGSRLYLARLSRVQDAFAARLQAAVPSASVERRYGVVLDALAVRLPVRSLERVEGLPGVAAIYPIATYRPSTDTVPALVGAVPLWGAGRSSAGQGIKVGVIDDGIDAGAAFLRPAGLRPPPGFPRGQKRFTSGRVIVARSFAGRDAPGPDHLAFDPNVSEHGTHVSGILAGAYGTVARPGLGLPTVRGLSGVAPGAWLGNYRGLARGDHESGAIGSTDELAAAVDRAVKDGMDVLNLSLGGPQIDPSADALSMALANAARAGVPSVVAAGNDFDSRGYGSISSPGSSASVITVAATSSTRVFGVSGQVGDAEAPGLTPFTAVPSLGPRVPAALGSPTRLVAAAAYGLGRRGCGEPQRRRRGLRAAVIVLRGGCGFGTKAINAREAGALAVIVAGDRPGPPFAVEEQVDLPLLVVTDAVGSELRSYVKRAGRDARVRFTRRLAELPTPPRVLTDFSSAGPTPFDLLLKPDISAPGEAILSSIPLASSDYPGAFASWEGTSMAAPAVTGVVVLMRERHPEWSPAQIRAALIGSAVPAYADSNATVEASPLRAGGGFVDAPGAVAPGVFSDPPMLGFGLQPPGALLTVPVSVSDAGDGAGVWQVRVDRREGSPAGAIATAPAELTVPAGGAALLPVTLAIAGDAPEGDATGFVLLTQGARTRRIPYWAHVERSRLATARARLLHRPGIVRGSTRGQPDRVQRYRYPAYTGALGLPVRWRGGEALYRFHLTRRAVNVGVTVETIAGGGLRPFLLRGLDENRVAGESGLPIDVGPSLTDDPVPSAGLYGAPAGDYAVSVDSAGRRGGAFRLRFWINDVTPPALGRLRVSLDARTLRVPVTDSGSGVDPRYLECALVRQGSSLDHACRPDWSPHAGIATIRVGRLAAGLYALALRAGDYAESRDALAIAVSPQHVRTRVIGLQVDSRGAIRVAAAPRAAAFEARRQIAGG